MVTPVQLLDLAGRLLDEHSEIADRSAVSRAYYAAFWHARRVVTDRLGSIEEPGAEVHREVARMTGLWDPDNADRLSDLRKARNLADYDEAITFDATAARELVYSAGRVLEMH